MIDDTVADPPGYMTELVLFAANLSHDLPIRECPACEFLFYAIAATWPQTALT